MSIKIETDRLLANIAREHLHIETLAERKSDRLDFHEVAVWSVKAALEAAYQAGIAAGRPSEPNYENSKHQILIDMLKSETGATLQEMADATGWRKHSVSCAISAVLRKKWNYEIIATRQAGRDCVYRINSSTI